MRFQSVHNLPFTGSMDTTTWHALVRAAAGHQIDPNPYTYVYVSTTLPETLTLYIDNYVFFTSEVNTGLPGAVTQAGTFPVYLRYAVTTMSGTDLQGKKYHDTGIPWTSYFNGGDALHGFIRSSYGYPQSLGCVEMTFAHAAIVWPHTPIGTLVTVSA
jgi:lipoprotein-anchoring transpeptidase ErfK/SrfK